MVIQREDDPYWSLHSHSRFSANDALSDVGDMVAQVSKYRQRALGLTDHGNMAGSVQLYKHCMDHDIKPFPGTELYVVESREDKKAKRHHMCVVAFTTEGYKNLVRLNTKANQNFYHKPLIDHSDLAELFESGGLKGVAGTSGCFFGFIAQAASEGDEKRAMQLMKSYDMWFDRFYVELQNHNITHDNGRTDDDLADDLWSMAKQCGVPVVLTQDSHYCNTPDAPIWMADLSYKSLGDIDVGDLVMGWEQRDTYRKFVKSEVLSVNTRIAEVFEITLASGKKIKCTSDHQWVDARKWRYKYYSDYPYSSPTVGMSLVQMIEPKEYSSSYESGWLGGMYDGEGSRSRIAQSPSHNPEVCARIEQTMKNLGFEYSVGSNGSGANVYGILGGRQGYTDFVNTCLPERRSWFNQSVVGSWASSLGSDEIVSMRSIGEGEVVSMTTSSGNYVAWGYASKNCHKDDKASHEVMKRLVSFGPDPDDAVFPGDGFHLADKFWMEARHGEDRYDDGVAGLNDLYEAHDLTIPQLDKYSYNIPFTVDDPQKQLRSICAKERKDRGLSSDYIKRMDDELSIVNDTGMAGYLLLVAQVTDWCTEQGIFYQARGSASGSVLCWLLGITQVDPLKYKLRFERFISRDRTKPPDIDLDVEHTRRDEIIEWLTQRFSVSQIGTWLKHSIDSEEGEEQGKGSLAIKYYAKKRAAGDPVESWQDAPESDREALYRLGEHGAYSGYGVHAAGLVVATTDAEIHDVVPQMKVASSKTMVTQYDMGDVESMGFVKLDLLGLKSLSILNLCIENLGKTDLDWIPTTDKKTYQLIARGDTGGVFQLEGWTARKNCS